MVPKCMSVMILLYERHGVPLEWVLDGFVRCSFVRGDIPPPGAWYLDHAGDLLKSCKCLV